MQKKAKWGVFVLSVLLGLSACCCSPMQFNRSSSGFVGGRTWACGCTDVTDFLANHQNQIKSLQRAGVQVVQVGDTVILVLPSDVFFALKTSTLDRNNFCVLNQIASFLYCLENCSIRVAGYSDNCGDPTCNVALTRQQALEIANYLWQRGVDARVMSSTGYGSVQPIATNCTATGRAMNRRVEISLRLYVEPDGD